MGVTTPPQANQRDNNEGQRKVKYYVREKPPTYTYAKDAEERFIRVELMILDQMDLHAAAAHAKSIGEANAEARAEYDRGSSRSDGS